MLQYDAVYTWTNFAYADSTTFGNNLAAYNDVGGTVVLGVFCTFTSGNSMSGTIMTAGYCPVVSPLGSNHFTTSTYNGGGQTCIYGGVASLSSGFRDVLAVQGTGIEDGFYADGEICHAYRGGTGGAQGDVAERELHAEPALEPRRERVPTGDVRHDVERGVEGARPHARRVEDVADDGLLLVARHVAHLDAKGLSAAQSALDGFDGQLVVLYGDTPLIPADAVEALFTELDQGAAVGVLGFDAAEPGAYGRLITSASGDLEAIVEAKEATPDQLEVTLCNSGVMAAQASTMRTVMSISA